MPKDRRPFRADARLIFGSSEHNADLLYATHFFAPDAFIYFTHRGKTFLVMNDLEIHRARQQARVDHILSLSEEEKKIREGKQKTVDIAAVLQLLFSSRKIRSLLVPSSFPLGLGDQLRRRGLRVTASPKAFFPGREIKRKDEIREIIKAQRAAEAGVGAAIEMIRQSRISPHGKLIWNGTRLTADDVKQRIASAAMQHGCIASHTIVACGQQGCDPHNEGSGALCAHKPIILDIFPRSQATGYWGDITRTVVRGRASERLKSVFRSVLKGQSIALKQIKEGARGHEIHQTILEYFDRQGFQTGQQDGRMQGFFHGTGHGVGLEIHEAPRISPRGKDPLKSGQVVTVEPGLYYSDVGGVRLEDVVVVTETGHRNLTRFPKVLEI